MEQIPHSLAMRKAVVHFHADTQALGPNEKLTVDEPVAWLTGAEDPPESDQYREAIARHYRRLRDKYGGRPPAG